jgi:general secretion pathway protein E
LAIARAAGDPVTVFEPSHDDPGLAPTITVAGSIGTASTSTVRTPTPPGTSELSGSLSEPNIKHPIGAPSATFLSHIRHEFARRHLILSEGTIHPTTPGEPARERLAIAASTPPIAAWNVGVRLGIPVTCRTVDAVSLAAAIDRAYEQETAASSPQRSSVMDDDGAAIALGNPTAPAAELLEILAATDADVLATAGKSTVAKLVDLILFDAIRRDASDVHIQPVSDCVLIRYRLDGVLHTVRTLPVTLAAAVTSRVKVMARLDVAEQRAPQDGRTAVTLGGSGRDQHQSPLNDRIDLRISTLPSTYGERVVIRLLHNAQPAKRLTFANLGMPPSVESSLKALAGRADGILLATGPTGSGKTTTLYTTLTWITQARTISRSPTAHGSTRLDRAACSVNIMTIEDPVEYDLSAGGLAISQTQVNPRKNVTFATGLRHILRQDPDVIMVGEIRDEETARIAVQASLTGHLVLSTLHTNDAASAVARLIDLGVEPFLVASSLSAVLAQRLLRRVHRSCLGRGCPDCLETGYQGRVAVFELLVMDAILRDMVTERVPVSRLRHAAVSRGMTTLAQASATLVAADTTTLEEVARVIHDAE